LDALGCLKGFDVWTGGSRLGVIRIGLIQTVTRLRKFHITGGWKYISGNCGPAKVSPNLGLSEAFAKEGFVEKLPIWRWSENLGQELAKAKHCDRVIFAVDFTETLKK
jgi:hypothetical protein